MNQFPHYSVQLVDKEGKMTREGLRFFLTLWNGISELGAGVSTVVLVDSQAPPHYWELSIDNTGALVTTDLGTTPP